MNMAVFSDVAPCGLVEVYRHFRGVYFLIVLMIEAVSTSETSVNLYQTTWINNPEDKSSFSHRRENLKSHQYRDEFYLASYGLSHLPFTLSALDQYLSSIRSRFLFNTPFRSPVCYAAQLP
jgi:hypothetical protein